MLWVRFRRIVGSAGEVVCADRVAPSADDVTDIDDGTVEVKCIDDWTGWMSLLSIAGRTEAKYVKSMSELQISELSARNAF